MHKNELLKIAFLYFIGNGNITLPLINTEYDTISLPTSCIPKISFSTPLYQGNSTNSGACIVLLTNGKIRLGAYQNASAYWCAGTIMYITN